VTTATVVLCPPLPGGPAPYDAADTADALLDHRALGGRRVLSPGVPDAEPGDDARTARAHWIAHLAVALSTDGAQAPVLLVLAGSSGAVAAALGFSQRASRRAVSRYVLVDAAVPPADDRSGDWPDAPVHYVASPDAEPLEVNQARLRGWDVVEVDDLEPATLADALVVLAAL
jgi:hypothetical protein